MEKSTNKVKCPECENGFLVRRNISEIDLFFNNENEYECDFCCVTFSAYDYCGNLYKQEHPLLPELKEGFTRTSFGDGCTIDSRKDRKPYISEDGLIEYGRIYDKYNRLTSKFILMDFSSYAGEPNIKS